LTVLHNVYNVYGGVYLTKLNFQEWSSNSSHFLAKTKQV